MHFQNRFAGLNKDKLTLFTWFHPKGNPLRNHKLFGIGQNGCVQYCCFDFLVGAIGSSTAHDGKLGVRIRGVNPGK